MSINSLFLKTQNRTAHSVALCLISKMIDKLRIFTQKELFELQKLIASIGIPMHLSVDKTDNSIDLDFKGSVYLQSILKKEKNKYQITYTTSNGDNKSFEHKEWNPFKYHISKWILSIKRDNPFELNIKQNIQKTSPNFYNIFKEASIIYEIGFEESSGMIFRKALEIIVKDFLKNQLPTSFQDLIDRKTIGNLIYHFYDISNGQLTIKNKEKFEKIKIDLEKLISLANIINNTFQIGNDFSHYERRLTEFSVKDIQERILKIADFIDRQLELSKLKEKQSELNNEFNLDKI